MNINGFQETGGTAGGIVTGDVCAENVTAENLAVGECSAPLYSFETTAPNVTKSQVQVADSATNQTWFDYPFNQAGTVIDGDLTVNGTLTALDELTVEDPIIQVAVGNTSSDLLNQGIVGTYNDGSTKYWGMLRQKSDGPINFYKDLATLPTPTDALVDGTADIQANNMITNTITPVGTDVVINDANDLPVATFNDTIITSEVPLNFDNELNIQSNASIIMETNPGKLYINDSAGDEFIYNDRTLPSAEFKLTNDVANKTTRILLDADTVHLKNRVGNDLLTIGGSGSGEVTIGNGANTYTMPLNRGSANDFLTSDGAGGASWTTGIVPTDIPSAGYRSLALQAAASGAFVAVNFATQLWLQGGITKPTTSRFQVPVDGIYACYGEGVWNSNPGTPANYGIFIAKNGNITSTSTFYGYNSSPQSALGGQTYLSTAAQVNLLAGDYVELYTLCYYSAGSVNYGSATTWTAPEFSISLIDSDSAVVLPATLQTAYNLGDGSITADGVTKPLEIGNSNASNLGTVVQYLDNAGQPIGAVNGDASVTIGNQLSGTDYRIPATRATVTDQMLTCSSGGVATWKGLKDILGESCYGALSEGKATDSSPSTSFVTSASIMAWKTLDIWSANPNVSKNITASSTGIEVDIAGDYNFSFTSSLEPSVSPMVVNVRIVVLRSAAVLATYYWHGHEFAAKDINTMAITGKLTLLAGDQVQVQIQALFGLLTVDFYSATLNVERILVL